MVKFSLQCKNPLKNFHMVSTFSTFYTESLSKTFPSKVWRPGLLVMSGLCRGSMDILICQLAYGQNITWPRYHARDVNRRSRLRNPSVKLRHSEKATKFEKISHLFWRYCVNVKTSGRFFQILRPYQKTSTLLNSAFHK